MMRVGPKVATEAANRYGILTPLKPVPSAVLGSNDVTAMDMASAYSTFANRGIRVPPVLVTRITRADGSVLFNHEHSQTKVLEAGIVDTLTSILEQAIQRGTGTRAKLDRPAAGKTGTSNDNRDAWFAGYTPDLVAASWVGFDDFSPLGNSETGGRAALPVWLEFMKGATAERPRAEFEMPPDVEQVRIDPKTGLRSPDETAGRLEVFAEGTAPVDFAPRQGEANPDLLFLEDGGGSWR
jgi:penicillin-binding protein 1A